ncbi:hypothetical protein [Pseudoroseomonas cervicalis]|uniref:hypothetical protein n=1 Tax=Teichococcus cervicalis TaxID=204525 RepID=UPI0022F14A58|nr:hypothetical protein [Pseudoroseomonas cervicalis]WBV42776.1 hypothetical protein PFY06_16255 [Pseudoroseomonas cervicalis]
MAEMLRAPERDRLIAYLEQSLRRSVTLGGREGLALRETHAPFATADWCWTADSAAAVELLAQPGLRPRWAKLCDGLTDFLLTMGEGRVLSRRLAPPELRLLRDDPRDLHIVTATHEFRGDLSRGRLRQSLRAGPTQRALDYTGHLVEFRLGRERFCLDVEDTIVDQGLRREGDAVFLFHESALTVKAGLLLKKPRDVGRLRYEYRIAAGDPRLHLSVTLRAEPGVGLTRLRLTTAVDELSGDPQRVFAHLGLGAGGAYRHPAAPEGDATATLQEGTTELVSLVEDVLPAEALGLHIAPAAPQAVVNVKLQARQGRPHWLLLRHGRDRLEGGQSFTAQEARLLTGGTDRAALADYAAMLRDPAVGSGRDPGLTMDPGVALNAVATQLLHDAAGSYEQRLEPARRASLRAWYDRHLEALFQGMGEGSPAGLQPRRAALRSLAFALLSLDAMHRATAEEPYALRLARGLDLLLAMQQPEEAGGAFAEPGQAAYLDGHAAAMLALSRIALRWPEPRLHAALRRALAAIGQAAMQIPLEAGLYRIDTPLVRSRREDGRWSEDGGFWSFKLGLLMRALQALLLAQAQGAVPLEPAEQQRAEALRGAAFQLLRGRVGELDAALELRTSPVATEGNAATQPVVLLGLTGPDAAIARLASAEAAA